MRTRLESGGQSRRRFLQAGGMALGAAAVGALPALGQSIPGTRERPKVRIGVVGGGFGATFQWHEDPGCTVEAVSDLLPKRREKLMKVYKCAKSYPSLEEMVLDKDIDAVAIFTGAPDHVPHTVTAMEHGKHVICAVPACMNIEEAEELLSTVQSTGLTYMMAETSYYRQPMISARKWYEAGEFGEILYSESEYHHPHTEGLWFNADGSTTWRHGFPPMKYPTHCTAFLTGLTGERLVEVTCLGWGDKDPELQDNQYGNPFWNATAFFKTDRGRAFRVGRMRKGAVKGCERAEWYGQKMSFLMQDQDNDGPVIIWPEERTARDEGGFTRRPARIEKYEQINWWETDLLPEPMRHNSGHGGSHTFLTHEFIAALREGRKPSIDIYESLAYTVPGIVAHDSALQGGRQMKIRNFDRT